MTKTINPPPCATLPQFVGWLKHAKTAGDGMGMKTFCQDCTVVYREQMVAAGLCSKTIEEGWDG